MKRNFYFVMYTLRRVTERLELTEQTTPDEIHWLIDRIFEKSEVQSHLTKKLVNYLNRYEKNQALLEFYINLDGEHQLMFDTWFNKEMEAIEATTIRNHADPLVSPILETTGITNILVHINQGSVLYFKSNNQNTRVVLIDEDKEIYDDMVEVMEVTPAPCIGTFSDQFIIPEEGESSDDIYIRMKIHDELLQLGM